MLNRSVALSLSALVLALTTHAAPVPAPSPGNSSGGGGGGGAVGPGLVGAANLGYLFGIRGGSEAIGRTYRTFTTDPTDIQKSDARQAVSLRKVQRQGKWNDWWSHV